MTLNKAISYAAAFVIALVVLLGGVLVVVPQLEALHVARTAVDTIQTSNLDTQARIDDLVLRSSTIGGIRDDLAALQASIPANVNASAFIMQLATSATPLGVTLEEISLGDPQPPAVPVAATTTSDTAPATVTAPSAPFLVIPVSLSVGGSYDGVLDFIDALRHGERLVSVTAFDTAFTGEADAVTGTITAQIYVLPTDAATD
ncbi:hypothetical protein E3O25_10325 [Cryobacterium sp. TMT1-3]|uniref:hypothetical protein n=1 Tax=Cryobacterium sp. TMT1-3 TaxID=1259237 RepID=UPI00106D7016|nr:hypothetical protein [Cryobacterium sp. TMT1-3]TFC27480.1 hypothetical protein E3O25_10325 [Cryobacterium sp. TMT1-3]